MLDGLDADMYGHVKQRSQLEPPDARCISSSHSKPGDFTDILKMHSE